MFTVGGEGNVAAAATGVKYDPGTAYLFRADFTEMLPGGWLFEAPWTWGMFPNGLSQAGIGASGVYSAGILEHFRFK